MASSDKMSKSEFCRRMDLFSQDASVSELMDEALVSVSNKRRLSFPGDSDQKKVEVACREVQSGEV